MSTKRAPVRIDEEPLHPVVAVALILAVCLVLWVLICALVVTTLVVAGSVGVLLLFVGVAACWLGVR